MTDSQTIFGVTVLPEYLQSESVTGVLDRIQSAGFNAVTTSPYVMEVSDEQHGAREPPIDAGAGQVRKLDRELWGKTELWVRTAPSFAPDRALYSGLRYQPSEPDRLTREHGQVLDDLLAEAARRNVTVNLQVQAAIPPGYRVQFGGPLPDDQPRMPTGEVPARRVANNASLASPEVVAYQHALLTDLCRRYPTISAVRVDWPEYPPYSLDDMFVDFSEHARQAAHTLGFDFERMREDAARLYTALHGSLAELLRSDAGIVETVRARFPGVTDLLQFKQQLSAGLLNGFRGVIDREGEGIQLAANLFPWPWSLLSGANYTLLAATCSELDIKLYGMHWKMMLRSYGDQLCAANRDVSSSRIVEQLLLLLDFMESQSSVELSDYAYTAPHEPFGVSLEAQRKKIQLARQQAEGTAVRALVHSYGPAEDFRQRLREALRAGPDGVWINRYGYLSDEKLSVAADEFSQLT